MRTHGTTVPVRILLCNSGRHVQDAGSGVLCHDSVAETSIAAGGLISRKIFPIARAALDAVAPRL